jgi:transposase
MILKARKVRLKPKERMALEILCRTPTTPQRDARRSRIVVLAAAGHSSRSIAAAVGVRPNVASLWRNRFADQGLEGLKDKPRPGKKPIYGAKTGKRILALLDRPAPKGYAR